MKADLVIKGSAIFDSIGDAPFAGFVATAGNRIIQVGKGDVPAALDGVKTIDAGERLIMPGFHDSHTHMVSAGMALRFENLATGRSEEDVVRIVAEAARKDPKKDGWFFRTGWYEIFWENPTQPTKASLDQAFPERPVFLMCASGHSGWANTAAIKACGITKDTPDPALGEIVRDESGAPTGLFRDHAMNPFMLRALTFDKEEEIDLVKAYMADANSKGLTSVTDVMAYFHGDIGDIPVYSQIDKDGDFTMRVHAAPSLFNDLDNVLKWKEKYGSEKLTVTHVKEFLDGVTSAHTALMLQDYADDPGNKGTQTCDIDKIRAAVPEAHRRGISVRLHAIGDRAVRYALDFYEDGYNKYGDTGVRHSVEHAEIVSPEDIKRFGKLKVIPSVQPEHIAITDAFAENPYPALLGKALADTAFPFKSLLDETGVLAFGTDNPVVSNNPMLGIYRAKTRVFNDRKPEGGWAPDEKLSLQTALKMYTWGGAYNCFRENELGTLREGNFADIIVLDRNLFAVTDDEILKATTDITIFDGKIVYEKS